jgi:hypothetical protein
MGKPALIRKPQNRGGASVLTFLLAVSGIFINAYAQQEPTRQLQQNGSAATNNKRIALVIGNGTYTSAPPLKNPPNDARDMAATLKVLGFAVSSAIDADQRTMKRLIREFGQQLKGGGQGLFYYAGHGVQMRGRNYLIPANADITSEADVEDQAVDLNLVLGLMDEAQNGLNIVILDACRNNPFTRSFRSAGSGLAQVDAPTGTLIAYATSPGRVASDGQGRNGLYTSELLTQMRVPGISVEEMFKRVRGGVQRQTAGHQVPWESSSLVGNFYFSPGSIEETLTADNAARRPTLDPLAFELSYWDTIKNSSNADDFRSYLEKYPNGQFAVLAKNRITSLEAPAKSVESKPAPANTGVAELTFWDSIKNSTNAGDFRAYLEKYPNGEFVILARNRLAPLEAAEKEKAKADDIARSTKIFKGRYGRWGGGAAYSYPGTLIVGQGTIKFVYDDVPENKSKSDNQTFKPDILQCSALDDARLDGIFIREISDQYGKVRFQAWSASDAVNALNAIRVACSPTASGANVNPEGRALEGTTWKGDSTGGDKRYEFQFLPNGAVVWHLVWSRLNNPTYQGTWSQTGDTIHMQFAEGESVGASPVEAQIIGDKINGSWNFGRSTVRWDNGYYKFTVTKVPK